MPAAGRMHCSACPASHSMTGSKARPRAFGNDDPAGAGAGRPESAVGPTQSRQNAGQMTDINIHRDDRRELARARAIAAFAGQTPKSVDALMGSAKAAVSNAAGDGMRACR